MLLCKLRKPSLSNGFKLTSVALYDTHWQLCSHAVVEVGLSPILGTVREIAGDRGARVNVSVVQGSLGDSTVSFIVSTINGSAQGQTIYMPCHDRHVVFVAMI